MSGDTFWRYIPAGQVFACLRTIIPLDNPPSCGAFGIGHQRAACTCYVSLTNRAQQPCLDERGDDSMN